MAKDLRQIVANLPESPGCYQYLNSASEVIYVGKAKNLKRRVASYFQKEHTSRKTRLLVQHIADIKYVVVRTEQDALLLENNLIKRYKPRYNVLLKDDKTYPSIAITHEYLPRIFSVRQRTLKGAEYYGPFSHIPTMHAMLELCRKLYSPRPCRTLFSEESVKAGKHDVCLEYHIRRCGAPCCGKQSREDYIKGITACREILRGNTSGLVRRIKEEMYAAASSLRFEEAQRCKERLAAIQAFQARSEVVTRTVTNLDVFHLERDGEVAFINYLHVTEGCINQAFTFEYKRRLEETDEELLRLGIIEMRERYGSTAREIVVPFLVDLPDSYATQIVPQRGDKHKLLELSRLNVKQYRFDRLKQAEKLNPEQKQVRLMKEIQRELGLERLPIRIELFDNSHLAGEDAVAACVVFEKLRPLKKEYRKFLIKSGVGGDDYGSMREVVRRRYERLRDEGAPLPDLLIADGGTAQMEAMRGVIEDELGLQIPIAGLAKNDRHRTRALLFGFPPREIGLKPDSQLFRTLEVMQEEVHRVAISFHRQRRSTRLTHSALDDLPGVGAATKKLLLSHFGTLSRLRMAAESELQTLLGPKRGTRLFEELQKWKA